MRPCAVRLLIGSLACGLCSDVGSIAGGGRYDGLVGIFGKQEIPSVGFSLGIERILVILQAKVCCALPIAIVVLICSHALCLSACVCVCVCVAASS
jgi:histidyl-tRNA synthetase